MVGNITMLVQKYSGLFLEGMGYTLLLALITVTFGTVLGTLVALQNLCMDFPGNSAAAAAVSVLFPGAADAALGTV